MAHALVQYHYPCMAQYIRSYMSQYISYLCELIHIAHALDRITDVTHVLIYVTHV